MIFILDNAQLFNLINSVTSNLGINLNLGNNNYQNNFNNVYYQQEDNDEEDEEEEFLQKKEKYILELDEFQYKHMEKFNLVKEDKCPICLAKYKGSDIIKEFPCKHIFHKKCILKWLKQSNKCPLCNHDITEDIKKVSLDQQDNDD